MCFKKTMHMNSRTDMVDVIWVDRPTRNPMIWFKQRKRIIDGITVLSALGHSNEYENFKPFDCKVWDLQISKYFRKNILPLLGQFVACILGWLKKSLSPARIYWPGDHFDPVERILLQRLRCGYALGRNRSNSKQIQRKEISLLHVQGPNS